MVAKWVEKGWVSIGDLNHLGWSRESISRLRKAVPEEQSGIAALGVARDLVAVNDWARDNGEPIVSSKALKGPRVRSAGGSQRKSSQRGRPQRNSRKPKRQPSQHELNRIDQGYYAQAAGLWFESKKQAHAAGYLGAKDLEDRLWTASLIEKLLGEPGAFGHNPMGIAPVRYWHRDTLQAVERTEEFVRGMAASLKRRKVSWEQAVSTVAKSNRELSLESELSSITWGMVLAERY